MNTFLDKHLRQLTFILGFAIVALTILIIGLMNQNIGTKIVTNGSYYVILVMTGFWVHQVFPFLRDCVRGKFKPLLLCLIMTVGIFASVPPKYRVLSDETNLLSVSQSMTYRKDISNVTQAKFYYGNLNSVQADLPTRPLLFPFLTSLVHTVVGYRYQNVFVLNFLILFAFLSLCYLVVESKLGGFASISTCLLMLSIPTLTLSASSGGFDVCSLFFFALSFVLLYRFLTFPTPERFAVLFIQLIMLAQIRYESIAYVAIILAGLFFTRKITFEMITKNVALFAAAPFFLIPMLLQRKLTPNTYENPPGVPPFAIEHFIKHAKILWESMIYVRPEYPYPSYLNWLAVIILIALVIRLLPKIKTFFKPHEVLFSTLLILCVGLSLTIVLLHHFGVFPHPTQARLFLIFLVFLASMPVVARYFFPTVMTDGRLFAIALVSFTLYHPVAVQGRFTNSLTIVRETEDEYRFLNELHDPEILVIAERPGQITVANYGAVGFGYANGNKAGLLNDLSRSLFSNIWVFQQYSFKTGKPQIDQNLDPEYVLEPVKDFMISADEFVRVSKVKHALYPVQAMDEKAENAPPTPPKLDKNFKEIFESVKFK